VSHVQLSISESLLLAVTEFEGAILHRRYSSPFEGSHDRLLHNGQVIVPNQLACSVSILGAFLYQVIIAIVRYTKAKHLGVSVGFTVVLDKLNDVFSIVGISVSQQEHSLFNPLVHFQVEGSLSGIVHICSTVVSIEGANFFYCIFFREVVVRTKFVHIFFSLTDLELIVRMSKINDFEEAAVWKALHEQLEGFDDKSNFDSIHGATSVDDEDKAQFEILLSPLFSILKIIWICSQLNLVCSSRVLSKVWNELSHHCDFVRVLFYILLEEISRVVSANSIIENLDIFLNVEEVSIGLLDCD
jgi:hypothetical protein